MPFESLPPVFQPVNNPANAVPRAKAWTQAGIPTATDGFLVGTEILDSNTGKLYELQNQGGTLSWVNVADLKGTKGDPGDTVISTGERQAIVEQVLDETESDIDPILLFENSLI